MVLRFLTRRLPFYLLILIATFILDSFLWYVIFVAVCFLGIALGDYIERKQVNSNDEGPRHRVS